MGISGFTLVRNATLLDFPVEASLLSLLPVVDELVVNVGESSDDTLDRIRALDDPRIRVVESVWDPSLGPAMLAGFSILGLIHIPPLHWRWLFWAPSVFCAVIAVCMAIFVKETPEEAGFPGAIPDETAPGSSGVTAEFSQVMRKILTNPAVWITACAYACTGAVRQAVDQWFPRYMQDLYQVNLESVKFQFLAFLIPFVASAGSLISG